MHGAVPRMAMADGQSRPLLDRASPTAMPVNSPIGTKHTSPANRTSPPLGDRSPIAFANIRVGNTAAATPARPPSAARRTDSGSGDRPANRTATIATKAPLPKMMAAPTHGLSHGEGSSHGDRSL